MPTFSRKLAGTVWASGCQSWYMDSRGKNTTLWPALTVTYRKATKRVNPADYDVVRVGSRESLATA